MNIIQWIIEKKYAKNEFQAAHIANRLKLSELHDQPEAQQERVKLYRRWRDSQVYGKNTAPCFEKAIEGIEAPQELFVVAQGEAGKGVR